MAAGTFLIHTRAVLTFSCVAALVVAHAGRCAPASMADTDEGATGMTPFEAQAAKIKTVDKSRLHSVKLVMNEKGEIDEIFVVQRFGPGDVGFVSAEFSNSVVEVIDNRPDRKPLTFAVGFQENRSQGRTDMHTLCLRTEGRSKQYFVIDKHYTVYSESKSEISTRGPFVTVEVEVTRGSSKIVGASVEISRGADSIRRKTDKEGLAVFEIASVKNEEVHVVVKAPDTAKQWESSLLTYMRGAQPNTVIHCVFADLDK